MLHTQRVRFQCSFSPPSTVHKGHEKRDKCITSCRCTVGPAGSWFHCSFSFFFCNASQSQLSLGTWCSGITSASHAEGPGFNPQCVHFMALEKHPSKHVAPNIAAVLLLLCSLLPHGPFQFARSPQIFSLQSSTLQISAAEWRSG